MNRDEGTILCNGIPIAVTHVGGVAYGTPGVFPTQPLGDALRWARSLHDPPTEFVPRRPHFATVWASRRVAGRQHFYLRRGSCRTLEIVGPFPSRDAAWHWQDCELDREWREPRQLGTWRK